MKLEDYYGGDWILKSRCWNEKPDPEMFFTEERFLEAKNYCAFCPVANQCISYANRIRASVGVFGAKSSITRKRQASQTQNKIRELEERLQELLRGSNGPIAS